MNTKSVSILLISADETVEPLIQSSLQPHFPGLSLHFAIDYIQALDILGQTRVDLVLINQEAAEDKALTDLRRLRAARPHLPIVMLIDLECEELAEEALLAGVESYLFKTSKFLNRLARNLTAVLERAEQMVRLRSSEEKLRLIFEYAFDGISIYEELPEIAGRRLLECNERYLEMSGYSRAELFATGNPSRLQQKVSRKFSRAENEQIRREQRRYQGLFSWIRPDGRENVIEYSASPINVDGRPLTIGIDRDITERILAQNELQRRAAHLSALNAVIGVCAGATNTTDLLRQAIDGLCSTLGSGQALFWLEDVVEARGVSLDLAAALRQRLTAQEQASGQIGVLRVDAEVGGDECWLAAPIVHENERMGGLLVRCWGDQIWSQEVEALGQAVGREIGAAAVRLRLLANIQAQARQMQMLVDVTPQAIILLDAEEKILLFNPAADSMFEPLGGLVQGQTLADLGFALANDLPKLSEPTVQETELPTEPRQVFEVTARTVDVVASDSGWLLVVRNVTKSRERQRRREQQARLAAVGQLAAGIAHDFNNLLASILLFIQLTTEDRGLSGKSRIYLQKSIEQVEHGAALVRQILDFGRRSMLNRTTRDLIEFLNETVELLHRTLGDSVTIRLECPTQPFPLTADFTLLQQVCLNLAINARDAMPRGGDLLFSLARLPGHGAEDHPLGLAPGEWYMLSVSDTGEGISVDTLPHIFEPFFTTKEIGQGTGLGLAQVYGIVQQHQGEIRVESRVGQGTCFTIYLPVPAQDAAPTPLVKSPETRADNTPLSHCILVIEDQTALREALCDILDLYGYTTEMAASGTEAVALFAENPERFDLVLSDMSMPEMTGLETHRLLRRYHPGIRTLILSGHSIQSQAQDWQSEGVAGWLQKPINSEELVAKIQTLLGDAGA